jgi:glycerophosphoryl diester phosphodiesterase
MLLGLVADAAARPLVIAHRGASGERPEHTESAYVLAIEQGADFIEPDLVLTKDGVFVARHENEIGETTDVASRPEFAARRATRTIDGRPVTGWFTEDFTLAELKTLRARERLPRLRPGAAAFDGRDPVPTFAEVVEIARREGERRGRVVGVYPELKHPTYFRSIGLPMEARFAAELGALGLDAKDAPVFVQSFEPTALQRLRPLIRARLVQLIAAQGAPYDLRQAAEPTTYADLLTDAGLRRLRAFADAIGAEKTLVLPRDAEGRSAAPTDLPARARAAGLSVHLWTFRAENLFLPTDLRRGDPASPTHLREHGDLRGELELAADAGVDGVFTDHPAEATRTFAPRANAGP